MSTLLEDFEKLGKQASYHYADDSGKEWRDGDEFRAKAYALYQSYPDFQPQMREIAKKFLWKLPK